MKNTNLIATLAATVLALSATLAHAGDRHEHGHSHTKKDAHDHGKKDKANHGALHGGQYVEGDNHHGIEMVATGNSLTFHVSAHHQPLDLAGSNFKVVVQTEAGTTMLPLSIEGSALKTVLSSALPKGAKVVVTGKDGKGKTIQARFLKE